MNILKLVGENVLTLGKFSVELDNRGLLLIQGINEDDTSADSNGAGKSSVVDALCWVLYGVTARGVTGDSIVNRKAKKNASGLVELLDGVLKYRIERYRKHATHKNQLFIYQIAPDGSEVDLSKGTDKETQAVVNTVMGCSLDVFVAAVYAGQERMPDLPGMTDKNLKLLIEEAAGVEELANAYAVARSKHAVANSAFNLKFNALTSLRSRLEELEGEIIEQRLGQDQFEAERKDKAKAELTKTIPVKGEIDSIRAELDGINVVSLAKSLDDIEASLKRRDEEIAEQKRLSWTVKEAEAAVIKLRTQVEMGKKNFVKAETQLSEVGDKVGTLCGECGKEYSSHDLDAAEVAAKKRVAETKAELLPVVKALKDAILAQETAQEALRAFEATMTDFSEAMRSQRSLSDEISRAKLLESQIVSKNTQINAINAAAKQRLSEINPWTKAVEGKQAEIDRTKDAIAKAEKEADEAAIEADLLSDAVKVFGPAGVRAHVLDTVTPFLNDRTQDYLGALADGNLHAEWSTISKTAKGELREKFTIDVTNDTGADSFAGLSGGEKRKVRLATAMALQDMVASRATKPLGLFIGDEIDHALDESGLERLMTVLERKARECGTVLVISHNSLSDWCDNVIYVTKNGGMATVTGSTERGF